MKILVVILSLGAVLAVTGRELSNRQGENNLAEPDQQLEEHEVRKISDEEMKKQSLMMKEQQKKNQENTLSRSQIIQTSSMNGYLILPKADATTMSWYDSWLRCTDMGAEPFIPRTPEDYQMIRSVSISLGGSHGARYMWVPASDISVEGELKWWDGQDAAKPDVLIWSGGGQHLSSNSDTKDCVIAHGRNSGVFMTDCSANFMPMICYKKNE